MRRLNCALVVLAALAATSCAATMSVSSHVEPGLDLSRYRTFDWGPADALPTGDPRLDQNPLFRDRVQGEIEKQLSARGIELSTAGTPDLLIHYHANITDRISVNEVDRRYGYCSGASCLGVTTDYEAGTLVVDIIDSRSNRLIWRGWAQNSVDDLLDDPDRMERSINQAITRMLKRLP